MSSRDAFYSTFQEWIELFMHRSLQGTISYAREKGLSMSMLGTLFHLNRWGEAGVSDLGQHLGVSSAAASQMLDRLAAEGLIERSEDPEDRRMKRITLTETGCQIFNDGLSARSRWLEALEASLTEEEKGQITAALQLIIDKVPQAK